MDGGTAPQHFDAWPCTNRGDDDLNQHEFEYIVAVVARRKHEVEHIIAVVARRKRAAYTELLRPWPQQLKIRERWNGCVCSLIDAQCLLRCKHVRRHAQDAAHVSTIPWKRCRQNGDRQERRAAHGNCSRAALSAMAFAGAAAGVGAGNRDIIMVEGMRPCLREQPRKGHWHARVTPPKIHSLIRET